MSFLREKTEPLAKLPLNIMASERQDVLLVNPSSFKKVSGLAALSILLLGGVAPAYANNLSNGSDSGSIVHGDNNTAVGLSVGNTVTGDNNSAFGYDSGNTVIGDNNVAIGRNAGNSIGSTAAPVNSTVSIGDGATASQSDAVAVGAGAQADTPGGVALGQGSVAETASGVSSATVNGITYSGFAGTSPASVVSVGSSGNERQVTNVAAGHVTSTSTDAVNGSQLYSVAETASKGWNMTTGATSGTTGQAVGTATQNVAPGGTVTYEAGNNMIVSQSGNTVSYGVNPELTAIESIEVGNTLVNTKGVTITGGPSVTGDGINAGSKKITNVADGVVAAGSTDAVNGGQLYHAINTKVNLGFGGNDGGPITRTNGETLLIKGGALTAGSYSGDNIKTTTDAATGTINIQMADSPKFGNVVINDGGSGKITGVSDGVLSSTSTDAVNGSQLYETNRDIGALDDRVSRVGAMSAALSGIQAGTYIESCPTQVGVGAGTYNGKYAVAAGVNHYSSKCVLFNAGAALSGGEVMGRAGVTIALETAPNKRKKAGHYGVSGEAVDALRFKVNNQNAQIQQLRKRLALLEQGS